MEIFNTRLIAENSRFEILFEEIRDGELHVPDYLCIRPKFRNADGTTGIAILPLIESEAGLCILLQQIYRPPIRATIWELPRGFIDAAAESPQTACLRELSEECGYTAEADQLEFVLTLYPDAGLADARIQLWLAWNCQAVAGLQEQELGLSGHQLFSLPQIRAMIHAGEIQDPCTLVACQQVLLKK